jgi:vacuolar-type H+-ATPase subunit C/Vma6
LLSTRYPFFSAYLKGEEARLVTSSHINMMSKTSSLPDILDIIKGTDIGGYLDGLMVETFDELDGYLWRYLGDCLERVEWFKPVPADMLKILKAYTAKYDVLNIKAALQGISAGRPFPQIPIGAIHNYGLLSELARAEDVAGLTAVLARCQLGNYVSALAGYQTEGGAESRLLAEARLDGAYYKNLLEAARDTTDGDILVKVFGMMIDMKNLQVMLRAVIAGTGAGAARYTVSGGYRLSGEAIRELLPLKIGDIPGRLADTPYCSMAEAVVNDYDRTRSIAVVDEVLEGHRFRLSREVLSPRVQSPLMIAWYLILKEMEIRNLRLISKAVFDNIPLAEIKNYLVLAA